MLRDLEPCTVCKNPMDPDSASSWDTGTGICHICDEAAEREIKE